MVLAALLLAAVALQLTRSNYVALVIAAIVGVGSTSCEEGR